MGKEDELLRVIRELLQLSSQMDPVQIRKLISSLMDNRNRFVHDYNNPRTRTKNYKQLGVKIEKAKQELIGKIPFILLSKNYFKSNEDVVKFADKLGISLLGWKKKSRDEIIGRFIINVSQFDDYKIKQLNDILNKIIGKAERGKINNFFTEWDETIKNLEFR